MIDSKVVFKMQTGYTCLLLSNITMDTTDALVKGRLPNETE